MTPAKIAERRDQQALKAVNDVGATIGLPEMQRQPGNVTFVTVPQIGNAARTTDRTLRKLTRVEKMLRAGVLERHEADACEYYADTVAMAWDTVGCTANYGGSGSGDYNGATERVLSGNKRQIEARETYAFISASLPTSYRDIFEAVICHNVAISAIAVERFADSGRTQREERTRKIVKFCANLVHGAVAHRLPVENVPVRVAAPVVRIEPVAPVSIVALVDAEIAGRPDATDLILSPDVLVAMVRELGRRDPNLATYSGLRVSIREGWQWAWILQAQAAA